MPRQSAATGIPELARQADIQILVGERLVRNKSTQEVRGTMSLDEALRRLLRGTGLRVSQSGGIYTLVAVKKETPSGKSRPQRRPRAEIRGSKATQPRQTVEPASNSFEEIIVTANARDSDPTRMASDTESLLHTAGDLNDPLKALLNLPGIALAGADLDPPIIRGGGTRDNLFLVQGIPIPNLYHHLSDSIINPSTLRSFDLYSAAFPLAYGDATGGVIDIRLRDPVRSGSRAIIDLSELKSGGLVEAAITDNISAYASYRINVSHLFFDNEGGDDVVTYYMPRSSDYSARVQWRGPGMDVSATILGSRDELRNEQKGTDIPRRLGQTETTALDAQSLSLALDLGSEGAFRATASHVRYDDRIDRLADDDRAARTQSWSFRSELGLPLGAGRLVGGVNAQRDGLRLRTIGFDMLCDYFETRCVHQFHTTPSVRTDEIGFVEAFAGIQYPLSGQVTVDTGIRAVYDWSIRKSAWEPRAGLSWRGSDALTVFARVGAHHKRPEPFRVLRSPGVDDLEDFQSSWQGNVGARWTPDSGWRLQAEGWYKTFRESDLPGTSLATELEGDSHGFDLLVAKPSGRHFDGWFSVSHTLNSRRLRPSGTAIKPQFDVPWTASLALTWRPWSDWSFGSKVRLQSGFPYTPLNGVRLDPVTGLVVASYGPPFSERTRLYSRIDLRVEKRFQLSFVEARVYLDLVNLFDRYNSGALRYSLLNAYGPAPGRIDIYSFESEGAPRFVALGLGLTF